MVEKDRAVINNINVKLYKLFCTMRFIILFGPLYLSSFSSNAQESHFKDTIFSKYIGNYIGRQNSKVSLQIYPSLAFGLYKKVKRIPSSRIYATVTFFKGQVRLSLDTIFFLINRCYSFGYHTAYHEISCVDSLSTYVIRRRRLKHVSGIELLGNSAFKKMKWTSFGDNLIVHTNELSNRGDSNKRKVRFIVRRRFLLFGKFIVILKID